MKKLIVMALVCGAGTISWARQPMLAPLGSTFAAYQADPYSPTPARTLPVPPAPGAIPGSPSTNGSAIPGTPPAPIPEVSSSAMPIAPAQPIPGTIPGQYPQYPMTSGAIITQPCIVCDAAMAPMISLYPRVRVIQSRNIAPCAIPKIVAVPDPCNPCRCVFITICVPPGACENIYCSSHKDRVVFDYGKYAVKVTNRRDTLVVNYDD